MQGNGLFGKKVFFLYPPPVLSEIVEELARREFEVYLASDHVRLKRLLPSMPETIVFINIDDGLDEPGWEAYLRSLREDPATASVGLGVVSLNDDATLRQKYLMDLQLPCGFVTLKIGTAKTTEILSKTLEANEARGRRKFVRATCPPGTGLAVAQFEGHNLRGEISDLSAAGMAVQFEGGALLRPGTVLKELQLSIKGARLLVDGFVAARREGNSEASAPDLAQHVVMFDPASLDDVKREKLRSLIFRVNQASMERLFQSA